MGGARSVFAQIEKKHGSKGIDYIVQMRKQRLIYEQTRDEIQRIRDHVNLQESEDIEWINQEKRRFELALQQATQEAQAQKKGIVGENEAKQKKNVNEFSGYNDQIRKLEELQKRVREQYKVERQKVAKKVNEEIRKGSATDGLKQLPEYDSKPESLKRDIEEECLKKYPSKLGKIDTVETQRALKWSNFKESFETILKRQQKSKEHENAINRMRGNVAPAEQPPVCC